MLTPKDVYDAELAAYQSALVSYEAFQSEYPNFPFGIAKPEPPTPLTMRYVGYEVRRRPNRQNYAHGHERKTR